MENVLSNPRGRGHGWIGQQQPQRQETPPAGKDPVPPQYGAESVLYACVLRAWFTSFNRTRLLFWSHSGMSVLDAVGSTEDILPVFLFFFFFLLTFFFHYFFLLFFFFAVFLSFEVISKVRCSRTLSQPVFSVTIPWKPQYPFLKLLHSSHAFVSYHFGTSIHLGDKHFPLLLTLGKKKKNPLTLNLTSVCIGWFA